MQLDLVSRLGHPEPASAGLLTSGPAFRTGYAMPNPGLRGRLQAGISLASALVPGSRLKPAEGNDNMVASHSTS